MYKTIYKPPFHIFGGWCHFSCFQVSLVWQQKSIIFLVLEVMVNLLRCKTYRDDEESSAIVFIIPCIRGITTRDLQVFWVLHKQNANEG